MVNIVVPEVIRGALIYIIIPLLLQLIFSNDDFSTVIKIRNIFNQLVLSAALAYYQYRSYFYTEFLKQIPSNQHWSIEILKFFYSDNKFKLIA